MDPEIPLKSRWFKSGAGFEPARASALSTADEHPTDGAGISAPPFRLVWSAVGRSTRKMHGKFVRSARTLHGKAVRSQRARPLGGKTQGDFASPSQGAILPAGPFAPTRAPPVSCVRDDLHPWGTTVAVGTRVIHG